MVTCDNNFSVLLSINVYVLSPVYFSYQIVFNIQKKITALMICNNN